MNFEGPPTPSPEELNNKKEEPEASRTSIGTPETPESSPAETQTAETEAPTAQTAPEERAQQPPEQEEPAAREATPLPAGNELESRAAVNAEGEAPDAPGVEPEPATEVVTEEASQQTPGWEAALQEYEPTREEKAWSEHVDAVVEEETRKLLPEKLAKARRGLAQLYDLLPRDRNPKEEEISALIDHTDLQELLPWWRKKLAGKIRWDELARKSKADFTAGGMELLYGWAYTEAMQDASGAVLERLRNDRGRRPARGGESAASA